MRKTISLTEPGPWRFAGGPRVLIEHPDPVFGLDLAAALRGAGCAVAICRGPSPADPAVRCPLHRLEPCAVVEGADVVVTALDLDAEEGSEVLRGLRTRYPSTAMVVAATPSASLELAAELEGCTVVAPTAGPDAIVATVTSLLE